MLKLEDMKIGDFFEMFFEELNRNVTCVYVGQKIVPHLSERLGYDVSVKLHCFIGDHLNYTHSYVAYGDEPVSKTSETFAKSKFVVSEACTVYDHYRHFTYKDGIYTRHHTKKLMNKHIARNYNTTAVEFVGNLPDNLTVEWMHLEML